MQNQSSYRKKAEIIHCQDLQPQDCSEWEPPGLQPAGQCRATSGTLMKTSWCLPTAAIQPWRDSQKREGGPSISRALRRAFMDNSSRVQSPRGILKSSNLGETRAKNLLWPNTYMLRKREPGRVGGRNPSTAKNQISSYNTPEVF